MRDYNKRVSEKKSAEIRQKMKKALLQHIIFHSQTSRHDAKVVVGFTRAYHPEYFSSEPEYLHIIL